MAPVPEVVLAGMYHIVDLHSHLPLSFKEKSTLTPCL